MDQTLSAVASSTFAIVPNAKGQWQIVRASTWAFARIPLSGVASGRRGRRKPAFVFLTSLL
jgi:hypothetical protein